MQTRPRTPHPALLPGGPRGGISRPSAAPPRAHARIFPSLTSRGSLLSTAVPQACSSRRLLSKPPKGLTIRVRTTASTRCRRLLICRTPLRSRHRTLYVSFACRVIPCPPLHNSWPEAEQPPPALLPIAHASDLQPQLRRWPPPPLPAAAYSFTHTHAHAREREREREKERDAHAHALAHTCGH